MDAPCPAPVTRTGQWKRFLGWLLGGALLGGLLACGLHTAYIVRGNLRTVVPGVIYRSGQPSAAMLDRLVQRHGIRSVINLRGPCRDMPWYQEERAAADRLGLEMADIPLYSNIPPSRKSLQRLIHKLRKLPRPLLIHCHTGADRTGLASAITLLVYTDTDLATARKQLDLRFGHYRYGKAGWIHRFLDIYQIWLCLGYRDHSPQNFMTWIATRYRQIDCLNLEQLEAATVRSKQEGWKLEDGPPDPVNVP